MTRISRWKADHSGPIVGGWSWMGPAAAEVMSLSDLDWVVLDAQHGSFNDQSALDALHVIPPERTDVLVRVPRNDEAWIGRMLDAGARGVIIPMVETADDAERAARACRYPADGSRSWGQVGGRWGRAELDTEAANAGVVCAVMVESRVGLDNVEAIAATPGVDMIFVGPYDLSIALGSSVEKLLSAGRDGELGEILRACEKHDVLPGAYAGNTERARALYELGFTAVAAGADAELLSAAASGIAKL